MKRFIILSFSTVSFYFLGAALGWGLVSALSPNTHDRAVEAVMSGFFIFGPIAAVIGGVLFVVVVALAVRDRPRAR